MLTMLWIRPGTVFCRLFCSASPIRSFFRYRDAAGNNVTICPPVTIGCGTNGAAGASPVTTEKATETTDAIANIDCQGLCMRRIIGGRAVRRKRKFARAQSPDPARHERASRSHASRMANRGPRYSVRIATIGVTRPARRAGTQAANIAAVSSSAAAAARLIGSNGLT